MISEPDHLIRLAIPYVMTLVEQSYDSDYTLLCATANDKPT